MNCPINPLSSTIVCKYENSSGTRCISSNIIFSLYLLRNPFGSVSANDLISGFSKDTYSYSGNIDFSNVVLPDCLGPVTAIIGYLPIISLIELDIIRFTIILSNY
jgi:hypothetical protein